MSKAHPNADLVKEFKPMPMRRALTVWVAASIAGWLVVVGSLWLALNL